MKRILEVFLAILTAVGGFVELGELVFSVDAGARFGMRPLWVIALGTLGIMVFGEIAGRLAAAKQLSIFQMIRHRLGFRFGTVVLVAALAVGLMTCAAEIGGIALLLELILGGRRFVWVLAAFAVLLVVIWSLSFKAIERVFGLLGLMMLVFVAGAVRVQPDWHEVARGFVPSIDTQSPWVFAYFAVALFSSILLPYETYFYSSGGIEDEWDEKDIWVNRIIVVVGFLFGSLLAVGLVVLGATLLLPRGIEPEVPAAAALMAGEAFGSAGVWIALLGMLFAFSGAAIENALSAAYNLSQHLGWQWGKRHAPKDAPRFHVAWMVMLALAMLVVVTGVDPVQIVEMSVVFAIVILPATYLPLLLVSGDRSVMGKHANGPIATVLGWGFFALVTVAALAAVPLFVATRGGKG